MSYIVDPKKTKKLLKSKKKEFIFYKVFEKEDGKLFSLFQHAKVDCVNELPEFKKNVFDFFLLEEGVSCLFDKKESCLHCYQQCYSYTCKKRAYSSSGY